MDCRSVRHRLPALVCGELTAAARAEVRQHLSGCLPCSRAWAALDPVGAAEAFGRPQQAPPGLRDAVMSEIRRLPEPSRKGARADTVMLALSATGVVGVWLALSVMRPLTGAALAVVLRTVAAGAAIVGTTAEVTLRIAHPILPLLAGVVVLAELILARGWVRRVS